MEEILEREGFKPTIFENEYVKDDWTIRFDDEYLEAFNDAEKGRGVYFYGPINKVDLDAILADIANFEFRD